jgi:hypothetical protein
MSNNVHTPFTATAHPAEGLSSNALLLVLKAENYLVALQAVEYQKCPRQNVKLACTEILIQL